MCQEDEREPLPKLDFSKGEHDPSDPNDPVFVAMKWWDKNVLAKGRPLTEEDLALLKQPLAKVLSQKS